MENIVNKMIFAGSWNNRNIENEREINFFSPRSQLVYINLKTAKAQIVTKQTSEQTEKGTKENIPCLLLSNKKHNLQEKQKKNLIIYFGGNGETIYDNRGFEFFQLAQQDSDVLLFGYPGYACSKSKASPENFYFYTEVLAKCLKTSLAQIYDNIVIIGWSIGCAAAINTTLLCSKENIISHLALINGFKNIKECAQHLMDKQIPFAGQIAETIKASISNDFDNEKRIQKIKTPLTIMYTPQDNIVNNKDSTTLYNAASKCKDKILKQIPGDHVNWKASLAYKIIKLHIEKKIPNTSQKETKTSQPQKKNVALKKKETTLKKKPQK
ncbi:MAG: hypothetical protein II393_03845 [Cytophagales bacterium]|nr:hypothetical protein [Cytophagales bacterium]